MNVACACQLNDFYYFNILGEFVKLFLVYSYDVPEHSSVVLHFAEYLKTFCRCDVYVDANDIKNKVFPFFLKPTIAERSAGAKNSFLPLIDRIKIKGNFNKFDNEGLI